MSESNSCKKGMITEVWRDILSSKGKKASIHNSYGSRSRRFMPNSNICGSEDAARAASNISGERRRWMKMYYRAMQNRRAPKKITSQIAVSSTK